MVLSLIAAGKDVLAGMFMAMTVYGGTNLPPAFVTGNGLGVQRDDNYRGYLATQVWKLLDQSDLTAFNGGSTAEFRVGGLYNARVKVVVDGVTLSNSWDAQGLVAVQGDRLVLTFRGTDPADPSVQSGQAFLGDALAANYQAFHPLIVAVRAYVSAHPGIKHVVVSGHSLGGALVDVFTLKDAASFRSLLPAGGLTIEAIASSGLPPDLPAKVGVLDSSIVTIDWRTIVSQSGVKIRAPFIGVLSPPADYVAFANDQDRVRWAKNFGNDATTLGLVPVVVLEANRHFGGDIVFNNPNMDNADVRYYDPLQHPLDFRGFGANHNAGLYWNDLYGLVNDPLFSRYTGQALTFGLANYRYSPNWIGKPLSLFYGYVHLAVPHNDWDQGGNSLKGSAAPDYVIGLSGNDVVVGTDGGDLVSGGSGADALHGGAGNDRLNGGPGSDRLTGGLGSDTLTGGPGADVFVFRTVADSPPGAGHDVVTDFTPAQGDVLDLSQIQAVTAASDKRLHLTGNNGAKPFTGTPGDVQIVSGGGQTLVQADIDGDKAADFEVALNGAPALTVTSFRF